MISHSNSDHMGERFISAKQTFVDPVGTESAWFSGQWLPAIMLSFFDEGIKLGSACRGWKTSKLKKNESGTSLREFKIQWKFKSEGIVSLHIQVDCMEKINSISGSKHYWFSKIPVIRNKDVKIEHFITCISRKYVKLSGYFSDRPPQQCVVLPRGKTEC